MDTIVALATPPGPSLRAVVRLSGPRAVEIAGGRPGAVAFRAPRSATREDVVEIPLPGSPPLVEACLRELAALGARPARPGEFTLRAFLHGRIDLAQAEAVEQLVASEDDLDRRAALAQLEGAFSRRLRAVEEALLDLCADAEAAIDFSDQDIEILAPEAAAARARDAARGLAELRAETAARRVSGALPTVVLYGRPNAGKSSLFNRLAGADALVAPLPGTTRDLLAAEADGVRYLDTAGDREAEGVEAEAVRRARAALRHADLVLLVVDPADPVQLPEPRGFPILRVETKADLAPGAGRVSALTGEGLEELRRAVARRLGAGTSAEGRFRVNLRQHALLDEAAAALDRAAPGLGMEFLALDLRAALDALGGITGRRVEEDLLDRVFSRFCLGK